MAKLDVHIGFDGNCEEAFKFYHDCIGAEILSMQTYGDSTMPVPENYKSKILHAILKLDNGTIMGADSMPDKHPTVGNNIMLSLDYSNPAEMEQVFNKLSVGGNVYMPLQDTFWNAKFGMLTDKFGINWMMNCNKPKE